MRLWNIKAVIALSLVAVCTACSVPDSDQDNLLPTVLMLPSEVPTASPTSTPPSPDMLGALDYDQPREVQLSTGQPVILSFSGERGAPIRIRARNASLAAQLVLTDPAGQSIATGQEIEVLLTQSGTHQILLTADADALFTVGLTRTDRAAVLPTLTSIPVVVGIPTPTPFLNDAGTFIAELSDDETAAGEFVANGTAQIYSFVAQAGQYARVNLTPVVGDLNLTVTLLDARGEALATDQLSAEVGAELRSVGLSEAGSYGLRVESDGLPGTYALRLRLYDTQPPLTPSINVAQPTLQSTPVLTPTLASAERGVRLSPGAPVQARLRTSAQVNTHAFYAREGETITISVRPNLDETLVPRIELVDPDGNSVADLTGGTRTRDEAEVVLSDFVTPIEGPYTIFVTAEFATSGAYLVAFGYGSVSSMTQRGRILPDQPATAEISQRGTGDLWFLDLRAGDVLTVTVLPQDDTIVPVLEVAHSDGTLLAIDAASGGQRTPRISGIRILKDGIHFFRVRPAQADQVGSYTLVWQYLSIAPTATPAPGILPVLTVFDSLSPDEYAFFPFYGEAGSTVRVLAAASTGSTLDAVIALIGPDGTVVAEADDTFNVFDALVEVTLPDTGTYQVRVGGYLSSGAFRVEVERIFQN